MKKSKSGQKKTFAFEKAGINQLNSQTDGIGVGLNTSQTLATALGGYLRVDKKVGTGDQGTVAEFGIAVSRSDSKLKFKEDVKILTQSCNYSQLDRWINNSKDNW